MMKLGQTKIVLFALVMCTLTFCGSILLNYPLSVKSVERTKNNKFHQKNQDSANKDTRVLDHLKLNKTEKENTKEEGPDSMVTGKVVDKKDLNTSLPNESVKAPWCPQTPPHLVGPIVPNLKEISPEELMTRYPNFEIGGRLRPKECRPRERLAIIVPFRNRTIHLHIMMNNLLPVLERQQVDVTFIVVEQDPPVTFNRGALLNIGFLEAEKIGNFDCFIFHDVDMFPLNDHNLYRCGDNPRHFAVSLNKFGYTLVYGGYFGGVVGFSKKQYSDVNGCSNIFFGWGGEDDDLFTRLRKKNYTMVRYDPLTARYDMIKHDRDKGNEANPIRVELLRNTAQRQDFEGLRSTKYKVNSIRQERVYTWINVSLNMTEILDTAPDYKIIISEKEKLTFQQEQKVQALMLQTSQTVPQIHNITTPK